MANNQLPIESSVRQMARRRAEKALGSRTVCIQGIPGHQNSSNLLGALNRRVTLAIVTADELIIAFGWLAGAFNKKVQFDTAPI